MDWGQIGVGIGPSLLSVKGDMDLGLRNSTHLGSPRVRADAGGEDGTFAGLSASEAQLWLYYSHI